MVDNDVVINGDFLEFFDIEYVFNKILIVVDDDDFDVVNYFN